MELIKIIIGLICFRMDEIKSRLEIEDKPTDIALLQGELRGLKMFDESMQENLTLYEYWEPIRELRLDKFRMCVLKMLDNQIRDAKEDERWQAIDSMVNSKKESMKDFLLMGNAKPRDLHLSHGKVAGLDLCSKTFFSIQHEYKNRIEEEERRKKEEPLMEFMTDENPEEEVGEVSVFSDLFKPDEDAEPGEVEEVIN